MHFATPRVTFRGNVQMLFWRALLLGTWRPFSGNVRYERIWVVRGADAAYMGCMQVRLHGNDVALAAGDLRGNGWKRLNW